MEMVPVSSSNLIAVGYDQSTQTLVVQFHNGAYSYDGVSSEVYQGLLNASSKGQYHHAYIKNSYPYRRIG